MTASRLIAVTGASGLLGSALVPALTANGHRVIRLVRRPPRGDEIQWDPSADRLDPVRLAGVDAVVHLAGENVGVRWTEKRKRQIRESRVRGTRLLAETLAGLPGAPRVLVSASAIGVYGDRGDELLTESSSRMKAPTDFFSEVGREWESATEPARGAGIRVVTPRFGIVLSARGGALARMLLPFRLGLGGRLGSGRQWMSWIALDDAVGAMQHALLTDSLSGPVNATSPNPVTNREFSATLAKVLRRPAVFPVPALALKLAFGEMAEAALLSSQRVVPNKLVESGFAFRYPELEGALRHVLGR